MNLQRLVERHERWLDQEDPEGRLSLTELDLRDADLGGRRLAGAELWNLDLTGAVLAGADLTSADLQFSYLMHVDLSGARLDGVNLYGAAIEGAKLHGASLRELHGLEHPNVRSIDIGPPGAPEILEGEAALAWLLARVE